MQISKHLKIFISSTFQDMQEEREELLKKVFVKLKKEAKQRNVEITEIDLRWGITEEDANSGQTVKICLDEIERCQDSPIFFLGILGNRYGWNEWIDSVNESILEDDKYSWIEEYKNMSITELEIISALERNSKHNKAFIYLKNQNPDKDIKLVQLKQRVVNLSKNNKLLELEYYHSHEDFREKVEASLFKALNTLFPKDETIGELEQLRLSHEVFAKSREKIYITHTENENKLSNFMKSDSDRMLLYGASGLGKSALIANYFKSFKISNPNYFVIEHYIGGAGALSSDFYEMLERVMREIKEKFNLTDELPSEPQSIIEEFALWLNRVTKPTLIIFDGYNQLEEEMREKLFYYLPKNMDLVKLIITSIEDTYTITYKEMIEPLNYANKKKFVTDYFDIYGKNVSSAILEKIASHQQTNNTLFLKTIMDEIRLISSFDTLEQQIEEYLQSKDTIALFSKIFDRFEDDYEKNSPNLTREVLSLLYVSRDGLSENNLMEILGLNRLEFSTLFLAIEEHLVDRNGLYTFFHSYIRESVKIKYLTSERTLNNARVKITNYFKNREINTQKIRELPYQLFELKNKDELEKTLANIEFFIPLQEMNEYELLKYVRFIDNNFNFVKKIEKDILKKYYIYDSEKNTKKIDNIALFFYEIYPHFQTSFSIYTYLLKLRENALGSEHINTAQSYNNLGLIYDAMGEYDNALIYHNKATSIREKVLGIEHLDTADSYNHLALLYEYLGEYDKSLILYQKSLKIHEKLLPSNSPSLHSIYNNLAELYRITNNLISAKEYYKKDFEICKIHFGKDHHYMAIYHNNLALYHRAKGEYKKSIELNLKALKIYKKILGENHPDTIMGYHNIAGVYSLSGNYETALSFYFKALELNQKVIGKNHSEVAGAYNSIGEVYRLQGKYHQALPEYYKSIEIYKKSLAEDNLRVAIVYNNLGITYKYLGDFQNALVTTRKALSIRKRVLGKTDIMTSVSYNNLAMVYLTMGKYKEALPLSICDIKILKESFGELHPDVATAYNNLAGIYDGLKKYQHSLRFYKKSLILRNKLLDKEHPHLGESYQNMGILYDNQKQYQKALLFAKKGLKLRKQIFGDNNAFTADSYSLLGGIYEHINKLQKSLLFYKKAFDIRKIELGVNHADTQVSFLNIKKVKSLKFH